MDASQHICKVYVEVKTRSVLPRFTTMPVEGVLRKRIKEQRKLRREFLKLAIVVILRENFKCEKI
jgi:hypothetical protein